MSLDVDEGEGGDAEDTKVPLCFPSLTSRPSRYFFNSKRQKLHSQRGIALILVIFIIALSTIIVVNLTYSTYLSARSNAVVERSLGAEYLLKSAINLAMALLKADNNHPDWDGPKDKWAKFSSGVPIPPELLGLTDRNLSLELEISPENQKINVKSLMSAKSPDPLARNRLACLFQEIGLNNDTREVAATGIFSGVFFDSKSLVSNLIDYMDPNPDTYSATDFPKGVKEILPKGTFPGHVPEKLAELTSIPGFTPHRMQVLEGFLTTYDSKININFASRQVLKCMDPLMDSSKVDQIMDYRIGDKGPFKNGDGMYKLIVTQSNTIVGYTSNYFQIIAKVDYGTKAYYARAIVVRSGTNGNGEPELISLEMI